MKLSKSDREWLLKKTKLHLEDYWSLSCSEIVSYENTDICHIPESLGREFAEFLEDIIRYKKLAGMK